MNPDNAQSCMSMVAQLKSWLCDRLRMEYPWHGLTTLPTRPDGTTYSGTNVLLLWMQQAQMQSHSGLWGSLKSLAQAGKTVRKGEKCKMAVYYYASENKGAGSSSRGLEEEVKPISCLNPICVFNEAQTEGYVNTPPSPTDATLPVAVLANWSHFADKYFFNWKQIPKNAKRPISDNEHRFIMRFSTDLMMIRKGIRACSIRGAYSSDACDAVDLQEHSNIMRLAGISEEIVKAFEAAHPGLPTVTETVSATSLSVPVTPTNIALPPERSLPAAELKPAAAIEPMENPVIPGFSIDW